MWRAPGLAEGDVLAGRFRIVRFIARRLLAASGAKAQAGPLLAQVEKDAAARGLRRIARQAAEARGA
jgi:hypothetical protein